MLSLNFLFSKYIMITHNGIDLKIITGNSSIKVFVTEQCSDEALSLHQQKDHLSISQYNNH